MTLVVNLAVMTLALYAVLFYHRRRDGAGTRRRAWAAPRWTRGC